MPLQPTGIAPLSASTRAGLAPAAERQSLGAHPGNMANLRHHLRELVLPALPKDASVIRGVRGRTRRWRSPQVAAGHGSNAREIPTRLTISSVSTAFPSTSLFAPGLDQHITPGEAEWWMKHRSRRSEQLLQAHRVREFARLLGTLCVGALGASWHYARMPTIRVGHRVEGFEFSVFDTVMSNVVTISGTKHFRPSFYTLADMVERRRGVSTEEPNDGAGLTCRCSRLSLARQRAFGPAGSRQRA